MEPREIDGAISGAPAPRPAERTGKQLRVLATHPCEYEGIANADESLTTTHAHTFFTPPGGARRFGCQDATCAEISPDAWHGAAKPGL
jgi:hypothetical protein